MEILISRISESGYNSEIGDLLIIRDYLEPGVPYVAMRMLPAILGILLVPIAFLTLRYMGCKTSTAFLAAVFITFENGLATQSRHILLDSPLIFFTALTALMWVNFLNHQKEPFSFWWWSWLTLTGAGLGATVSVKWVGLFTIAMIGVATLMQLWELLGDTRVSSQTFVRHFIARAICLILVPIVFYMMMFGIHFAVLQNSGDGDGFMSSKFQHTLRGHGMADTFADVALGSRISLKHVNTQGGYLHSHKHNYPTGSKQQQITLYPHRDENNDWLVLNTTDTLNYTLVDPIYIKNGDVIRLDHIMTKKKLHSHDHRPPITEVDYQNEVSAYGFENFEGDANDHWRVEIDSGSRSDSQSYERLRSLRTTFRLQHVLSGCYLFSHKVKLPEWGFEQQEVTCVKGGTKPNTLWYVETNTHPNLPENAQKVNYDRPSFFSKFWELQKVMWRTNAGLTDSHAYQSTPSSWPTLRRGINFWSLENRKIYLIGNPLVWYMSTLALVVYAGIKGLLILRSKRGYEDYNNSTVMFYDNAALFLFLGWALHYLPFFLMARQLFLHHYFPALYFAVLLLALGYDLATAKLKPQLRAQVTILVAIAVVITFTWFSPLTYGNPWTKAGCRRMMWRSTWDFDCNLYHDSYDQYSPGVKGAMQTSAVDPAGKITTGMEDKPLAPNEAEPAGMGIGGQHHMGKQAPASPKAEAAAAGARVEKVQWAEGVEPDE